MKNIFKLLVLTLVFSCTKEIETENNNNLNFRYDNSNLGDYQSVFGANDASYIGFMDLEIEEDVNSSIEIKLLSGETFELTSEVSFNNEEEISLARFYNDNGSELYFSVNADGTNPTITGFVFNGINSKTDTVKQTSEVFYKPIFGSFMSTDDLIPTVTGNFNINWSKDLPTSSFSGTLTSDLTTTSHIHEIEFVNTSNGLINYSLNNIVFSSGAVNGNIIINSETESIVSENSSWSWDGRTGIFSSEEL